MTTNQIAPFIADKSFDKSKEQCFEDADKSFDKSKEQCFEDTDKKLILEQMQTMQHLSLENIKLGPTATEIIPTIYDTLKNLGPSLKKLTLVGDRIDLEGVCCIANLIRGSSLSKLKIICVRTRRCNPLPIIINALKQSSVRNLKLSGLCVTQHATEEIIGAIKGSQLDELCLDNCSFETGTLFSIMDSVSGSSLQTLRLHNHSFDDTEIIALTDCIKGASLIKLCLRGSFHCSQDISRIFMFALMQSNIENLSLCCDNIGGTEISNCIAGSHIKKLKLRNCFNIIADLKIILDGVIRNNFIESLSIRDATITDSCLDAICNLLENSNIKSINLTRCCIKDDQLITLIGSIKKSSLRSLGLKDNNIKAEGALAICELLENYDLTKLNLDANILSHNIIESMMKSIKVSTLVKLNIDTYWTTDFDYAKTDERIKTKIKKILQAQQQILYDRYKMKSSRAI